MGILKPTDPQNFNYNFQATTDPTADDDITMGYLVGARWINVLTQQLFVLFDNEEGAAVWTNIGSGAGGAVTVLDEGVSLGNFSVLNFVGSDVDAQDSGIFSQVNIFIPPPAFASHFDTTDGTTTGTVSETLATPRTATRISTPSGGEGSPFFTGGWADSNQDTTLSSSVIFDTPQVVTGFGGDSTMTVNLFRSDGSANQILLETFTTPAIAANGNFVSGNITVNISSYGADSTRFSAIPTITVNAGAALTTDGRSGGRYQIQIIHNTDTSTDGTGPYTFLQDWIFIDTDPATPSLSGVTIGEDPSGTVVTKFLSGLEYYGLGSEFQAQIADIDDHNSNTQRVPTTTTINAAEYGLPTLNQAPFTGGSGATNYGNYTNDDNQQNVTYDNQGTNYAITNASYRRIANDVNISGFIQDPWNSSGTSLSPDRLVAIDTFLTTGNSTSQVENYIDEEFRQTDRTFNGGSATGDFNSSILLATGITYTTDSGDAANGIGAMVFNDQLMHPQSTTLVGGANDGTANSNWTNYFPNAGGQPDYSVAAYDRATLESVYFRTFTVPGFPSTTQYTSGEVTIVGNPVGADFVTDLENNDIRIYLRKIDGDGNTGLPNASPIWLHGAAAFNFATFDDGTTQTNAGATARTNSSGNTVQFTFGGFFMEDGLYVEIVMSSGYTGTIDSLTWTFTAA